MVLIPLAIAIFAAVSMNSYSAAEQDDAPALRSKVGVVRQVVAVVSAIVGFLGSILDALTGNRSSVRAPRSATVSGDAHWRSASTITLDED